MLKYIPAPNRAVVVERKKVNSYKTYLPAEYRDIWRYLHENGIKIDVIVIINIPLEDPEMPEYMRAAGINKVFVSGRRILRETDRSYKIYLPAKYRDLWELITRRGAKIDLIIKPRDI